MREKTTCIRRVNVMQLSHPIRTTTLGYRGPGSTVEARPNKWPDLTSQKERLQGIWSLTWTMSWKMICVSWEILKQTELTAIQSWLEESATYFVRRQVATSLRGIIQWWWCRVEEFKQAKVRKPKGQEVETNSQKNRLDLKPWPDRSRKHTRRHWQELARCRKLRAENR